MLSTRTLLLYFFFVFSYAMLHVLVLVVRYELFSVFVVIKHDNK